ncbi:Esterase EstB [Thalassoglobus neptunius]|uniref:Esterase EstB n=1 Tax=Thalassoglobus neptunius TaxID=1938619 RepID=A0A5C5VP47_9PLAN|nr:serine hydrolase [Thalassoglobus neptunius]TWT39880.1 Esterase EstB [Thalassoglobus neptunius]
MSSTTLNSISFCTLFWIGLTCSATWSQEISQQSESRASEIVNNAIESGQIAGAVHIVSRNGEIIFLNEAGVRDIESGQPMDTDTLVRIYSMSKPITSVAAMVLYEQDKFDLDDPVLKFIPSFTNAMVWSTTEKSPVPPTRPMRVRDVFRHTTGYAYSGNGNRELEKAYSESEMKYREPQGMFPPDMSIEEAAEALSRIPAHHHPGERFTYGFSTDLLGRLIEVWSGKTLAEQLQESIFDPLEMRDTSFSVSPEKQNRFASCHTHVADKLAIADKAVTSPYLEEFAFLSGGGGLVSTASDYAKFCDMLVNGGQRDGVRILKEETQQLMFTDQLEGAAGDFRFGLGFAINDIVVGTGVSQHSVKQYSWGGYASTDFRVVPEMNLYQIFIRQHIPSSHQLANQAFDIIYKGVNLDEQQDRVSSMQMWPGWLGPNRDGWVSGFKAPEDWPDQLSQSWSVEVGTGYGTPLVVNDRIYQHARQGEDEVLWCLNRQTGKPLWRRSIPTPFTIGGGAQKHGKGPKSNPFYMDEKVFTLGITGVLSAWDAENGDLIWQRDESEVFGTNQPYWGVSTSPIADENALFVHFGNDERGSLYAISLDQGENIWTYGSDGTSYSSPLLVELQGVEQLVEWNHRALVGIDVATGQHLWEFPFPHVGSDQNMPTPVFENGRFILGGENRGIHSLKPERTKNGQWSVHSEWHQKAVALDMSSAVINDGLLFGFSHYKQGQLFCLDPETGEILWTSPGRTGENVAFLSIPEHVIALVNTGELRLIEATGEEYRPVRSWNVSQSETWAAPALLSDGVLIKNANTIAFWSFSDVSPRDSTTTSQ